MSRHRDIAAMSRLGGFRVGHFTGLKKYCSRDNAISGYLVNATSRHRDVASFRYRDNAADWNHWD
jgi:hypothetical protein